MCAHCWPLAAATNEVEVLTSLRNACNLLQSAACQNSNPSYRNRNYKRLAAPLR